MLDANRKNNPDERRFRREYGDGVFAPSPSRQHARHSGTTANHRRSLPLDASQPSDDTDRKDWGQSYPAPQRREGEQQSIGQEPLRFPQALALDAVANTARFPANQEEEVPFSSDARKDSNGEEGIRYEEAPSSIRGNLGNQKRKTINGSNNVTTAPSSHFGRTLSPAPSSILRIRRGGGERESNGGVEAKGRGRGTNSGGKES